MLWKKRWLALAALLAGLVVALGAGCSKYDTLERNMQYVSDDLVRGDAQAAWENVSSAHERWRAAGGGHEAGSEAYVAYQDAYAKYAIIYNELWDRQNGSFSGHLHGATDALPPSPPGMNLSAPRPKPVPTAAPASGTSAPKPRQLNDAAPASPSTGVPMGMAAPLPATTPSKSAAKRPAAAEAPAGGDRYVVAAGDTLRLIAKRHGISEKALMEANGITDPDKISAGKPLTIPAR